MTVPTLPPAPPIDPPKPGAPAPPPKLKPRRAQALAAVAPMLGVFLLMPPFINVFAPEKAVFGVPLILAYLMVVWVGLIAVAFRLSGRLRRRLELNSPRPRPDPPLPQANPRARAR